MTKEITDLINKLTEEKSSKSKLTNIDDYKAGLKAMAKALTIHSVIKRFFVVYDYLSEKFQYMETAWSEEEVNKQEMWIVESEHNNKEEARKECDRLNAL